MTTLVIVVVVVFVVGVIVWSRLGTFRSDRRSMENYERALDVLGDVSSRSERSAKVRVLPHELTGAAHVRTDEEEDPERSEGGDPRRGSLSGDPRRGSVSGDPRRGSVSGDPARPSEGAGPAAGKASGSRDPEAPVRGAGSGSGGNYRSRFGHAGSADSPPARPLTSIPGPAAGGRLCFGDDSDAPAMGELGAVAAEGATAEGNAAAEGATAEGNAAAEGATPEGHAAEAEQESGSSPALRQAHPNRRVYSVQAPRTRRAVTGAAAAVALVAIAVVGLELAGGPGHAQPGAEHGRHSPSTPTGQSSGRHHSAGHHSGRSGSGGRRGRDKSRGSTPGSGQHATALRPTSSSPTGVNFRLTSDQYELSFTDTGSAACWIGVQKTGSSGWLWMATLMPGQSTTYQASGAVSARLGAPKNVNLKVSGVPAELPDYVQPYDVTFSPLSGASTS